MFRTIPELFQFFEYIFTGVNLDICERTFLLDVTSVTNVDICFGAMWYIGIKKYFGNN